MYRLLGLVSLVVEKLSESITGDHEWQRKESERADEGDMVVVPLVLVVPVRPPWLNELPQHSRVK